MKMSKYENIKVGEIDVLCNFVDKDIIEDLLISPDYVISLFKRNKKTNNIEREKSFQNERALPTIEAVIESIGFQVHTFDDCVKLYGDVFENDDLYLPFDDNEVYITLDDVYQGCCTRGGFEFSTKDFHYFFGITKEGGSL
jgi:hypothetical protein